MSTVVEHPAQAAILLALAKGESIRDVAVRFGLSKSEVGRYSQMPRPRQFLELTGARKAASTRRENGERLGRMR
jgi:transposase